MKITFMDMDGASPGTEADVEARMGQLRKSIQNGLNSLLSNVVGASYAEPVSILLAMTRPEKADPDKSSDQHCGHLEVTCVVQCQAGSSLEALAKLEQIVADAFK